MPLRKLLGASFDFRVIGILKSRTLRFLWVLVVAGAFPAFTDNALTQSARAPSAAPVMTEELMARLIKYTLHDTKGTGTVDARICKFFNLCDGTKNMQMRLAKSDFPDGIHYFGIPPETNSTDILIMVKHDTVIVSYLTDKTAKLRAAAVLENGTMHLIVNEKAAAKFKVELALFAKEAAELPPSR
jgi:hypothetical protein